MRFSIPVVVCAAALLLPSSAAAQLKAVPFVSGLNLPLAFVQDPGDATIQYVLQQGGRIRLIRNGALQSTPFLDLTSSIASGGERGLLGMALPPDYATSGRFFVNFTNTNGDTVIARFRRSSSNPLVAAAGDRRRQIEKRRRLQRAVADEPNAPTLLQYVLNRCIARVLDERQRRAQPRDEGDRPKLRGRATGNEERRGAHDGTSGESHASTASKISAGS